MGQGKKTSAERRKERQEAMRAAAAKRARKVRLQATGAVLAVALVGGGAYGAVEAIKNHKGGSSPSAAASASPTPSTDSSPAPAGKANCTYLNNPGVETGSKKPTLPPSLADATTTYYATMVTDHGTIEIELDSKTAPCTVNSFVSLANQGFYDNTICHRLLDMSAAGSTDAVLQCGDPTGTGRGGPGYKFADENLTGAKYPKGEVAMANAGANTNGSQFFMMFKDSTFEPNYTPFGHIISGVEVIENIAKGGTELNPQSGANDAPKTKTTIQKVTISTTPPKGVSTASPKASSTATPKAGATSSPSPSPTSTSTSTSTATPKP